MMTSGHKLPGSYIDDITNGKYSLKLNLWTTQGTAVGETAVVYKYGLYNSGSEKDHVTGVFFLKDGELMEERLADIINSHLSGTEYPLRIGAKDINLYEIGI